ncbi:MAG: hypothetical protein WC824_15735 [Bacteroidota bacterium]|jgi:hypothetical protein
MDGCYRLAFRRLSVAVLIIFAATDVLYAQADLEFRRITVDWPEIELAFVFRCDTTVMYPTDAADVHILDNYLEQTPISIARSGDETLVRYVPGCASGLQRTVFLAVTGSCGGSPAQNLAYRAPYDPTTYRQLFVSVDTLQIAAGKSTYLPVRLQNSPLGSRIPQTTIRFSIDTTVSRITGAVAPSGTLLSGQTVTYNNSIGTMVTFESTVPIQDAGILFYLVMEAPSRSDTACSSITVTPATSIDGGNCVTMNFSGGLVCSSPPKPLIVCELPIVPDTLRWDASAGSYLPAPFIYKAVVRNIGNAEARTPVFRLIHEPADLILRAGYRDTVLGRPTRVAPGATSDAEWRFDVPINPNVNTSTRIGVEVDFGNHETISCFKTIYLIRDSFIELRCALNAPNVGWNDALHEYLPMPIPLDLTIENSGTAATDTIFTEVLLPPGMSLTAAEAGMQRKVLTPAALGAGHVGNTRWMLTHPVTAIERQYDISVRSWSRNVDTVTCRIPVTIPAAGDIPFAFSLGVSGATTFCDGDSVTFDGGTAYMSWRWSTGDTTSSIVGRISGQYWCEVRDVAGGPGLSDTVRVTVHALPPVPVISRAGDVLRSSTGAGYSRQWYRNAQALPGATADTLHLPDVGGYSVSVRSPEGCESMSAVYDVTILAIDDRASAAGYMLRSWPEPVRDVIHVEAEAPAGQSVSIMLVDLLGRSELLFDGVPTGGRLQLTADLRGRASGVWLLVMRSGTELRIRAVTRL